MMCKNQLGMYIGAVVTTPLPVGEAPPGGINISGWVATDSLCGGGDTLHHATLISAVHLVSCKISLFLHKCRVHQGTYNLQLFICMYMYIYKYVHSGHSKE